jgi:cell division protein FtsA
MDTRIGYPNEHLAGDSDEEFSSPLYATAVGLVMNSIDNKTQSAIRIEELKPPKPSFQRDVQTAELNEKVKYFEKEIQNEPIVEDILKEESTGDRIKRSFFDRYVDKIKDFLDNAE